MTLGSPAEGRVRAQQSGLEFAPDVESRDFQGERGDAGLVDQGGVGPGYVGASLSCETPDSPESLSRTAQNAREQWLRAMEHQAETAVDEVRYTPA